MKKEKKLKKIYKALARSNRRLSKEAMGIAKKTLPKD